MNHPTSPQNVAPQHAPYVWGSSKASEEVRARILAAQASNDPVVLVGDAGTGKNRAAAEIHEGSSRGKLPLVRVNVAAVPSELFESEFFGHEKGAFTGATEKKIGFFERAHGSSLILDEVGVLDRRHQAKFLLALETGEIQRIGAKEIARVDARVIATTNADLEARVRDGSFRQDLYDRLSVIRICMPPLAARREDIPALLEHFLGRPPAPVFAEEALAYMVYTYRWPGNIRQLKNVARNALGLAGSWPIPLETVQALCHHALDVPSSDSSSRLEHAPENIDLLHEEMDRQRVKEALHQADGNRTKAAQLYGTTRRAFYGKLWKYGLVPRARNARKEGK